MMVFEDPPDDSAREIQTAKMGCHAACMCVSQSSAHTAVYSVSVTVSRASRFRRAPYVSRHLSVTRPILYVHPIYPRYPSPSARRGAGRHEGRATRRCKHSTLLTEFMNQKYTWDVALLPRHRPLIAWHSHHIKSQQFTQRILAVAPRTTSSPSPRRTSPEAAFPTCGQ